MIRVCIIVCVCVLGDGGAIQDCLQEVSGGRTVPRVFVGGKYIGGGTDVRDLQKKGRLTPLLKDVGAL